MNRRLSKQPHPWYTLLLKLWRRLGAVPEPTSRHQYKATWRQLSRTRHEAALYITGYTEEERIRASAEQTGSILEEAVGIKAEDIVLEIGCGFGRVGQVLAPRCKQWIGCDVSANMLTYARERLEGQTNVQLVEVSGYDLHPIADASVDLVYCTVVFMHLEEWDRYGYVLEAHRVLRPGGRVFVDNINLRSDEGWHVFGQHRQIPPLERPPWITKSSTPQEIEAYLCRAGFAQIQTREEGVWVRGYGVKP